MGSTVRWVAGVLAGVLWSAPVGAVDPAETLYQLEIQVRVEQAQAPPQAREVLGPGARSLSAAISRRPVRRFRDGSIGYLIRFESALETLSAEAEAQQSKLQGRTFELRSFEDGEVLDIQHGRQIAGWGKGGDLMDLMLPLLSTAPPRIPKGQKVHRRVIWPFRIKQDMRWDNAVEAEWVAAEMSGRGRHRRSVLEYSGPWTLKGRDLHRERQLRYSGEGDLRGVAEFDSQGLLRHRVELERTVSITVKGVPLVAQQQVLKAELVRTRAGVPQVLAEDEVGVPLPRYLDVDRVNRVVQSVSVGLNDCAADGPAHTLPIQITVDGGGAVREVEGVSTDQCIHTALLGLRFPEHDGPDALIRFTVFRRDGTLLVSPIATLDQPAVGPLLIHPVGDWPTASLEAAAAAMGRPLSMTTDPQQ